MPNNTFSWLKTFFSLLSGGKKTIAIFALLYLMSFIPSVQSLIKEELSYIGGWRHIIGWGAILHLLIMFFAWGKLIIETRYTKYQARRNQEKYLQKLSEDEKVILRCYINNGTKTQLLSFNCGKHAQLETDNVIYRASTVSTGPSYNMRFAYNITPWAWEYLNRNKALLD